MKLFDPKSAPDGIVYKDVVFAADAFRTADSDDDDDLLEFDVIASDESVDRMSDVILADGWDLQPFRENNIILHQHRHDRPIGTAPKVWQEGTRLHARIRLAEPGTSEHVDEVRSLIQQRVLKAVSVGFMPTKYSFLDNGGIEFQEQELTEISIVSVPANRNATIQLSIARAYGVSDEELRSLTERAQPRAVKPRLREARRRLIELA